MIVCGGTGLFPFLDLLDFMLKKAVYMAAVKEKGYKYAENYIDFGGIGLESYLNSFKLNVNILNKFINFHIYLLLL